VRAARFDSAASQWEVELEDGAGRARFLVAAVGALGL
jgi:cation diffusion facilitator CzcD-associated flavoprotein CzcO